ncbi:MAG: ATP-dependent sacrificial sulfur transferase LarE [Nanoarchaeota archaeon]
MEITQKYENLKNEIKKLGSAIVAFSGGVDSVLVLKAAYDAFGQNVVAVTADSPSLPRRELEEAKKIAKEIGARHLVISTAETENESYFKNPNNRCYYCKTELYNKLKQVSIHLGIKNILNGTNSDDLGDYRPGLQAADEHKVISPLKDAKLTKNEIREMAKYLNLRSWDKPSSPCLSSRVPYGQEITLKKLKMVEEAENFLKDFGIFELRVRHFGKNARIEVNECDKIVINNNFDLINKKFTEIGFDEIEISDFKSGNLNILIKNE